MNDNIKTIEAAPAIDYDYYFRPENELDLYEKMDDDWWLDFCGWLRWDGKIVCPHCGWGKKIYTLNIKHGNLRLRCGKCSKRFNCFSQTIFKGKRMTMQVAMYLIENVMEGNKESTRSFARDELCTQKTAYYFTRAIGQVFNPQIKTMAAQLRHILRQPVGDFLKLKMVDGKNGGELSTAFEAFKKSDEYKVILRAIPVRPPHNENIILRIFRKGYYSVKS